MLKSRSPEKHEFEQVLSFLNQQLRADSTWAINLEYPTAVTPQNIHNMSIIESNDKIVSHALFKPLITKTPSAIYKIGAIGSVVTDPSYRQQGLSTLNMQNCLNKATEQNCDLVVLWSDQQEFYRKFGFELAGIEYTYVFDQPFKMQNENLKFIKGTAIDPNAILKLYSQHTVNTVRTVDEIQQFLKIPNSQVFTAWSESNQLLAYAVEGKGADLQSFIHEWGGQVPALTDLFSHIVKTEQKNYHIMVPTHSTNMRSALDKLELFCHQGFMGMIRIHNFDAVALKVKKAFRAEGYDQFVLEKNNGQVVFGCGTDLYTLDHETDLVKILFGPAHVDDMTFIKAETRQILKQILPLPLWIWGWDSI